VCRERHAMAMSKRVAELTGSVELA
jgi:hypothetical protein